MFQRQRTETEGLCSSVRKTFVKVCGSRDICTTDFLFFPPLHSNLTRGNKSWANPSSGNRARISRGHRQGKRRCSLDRERGAARKIKIRIECFSTNVGEKSLFRSAHSNESSGRIDLERVRLSVSVQRGEYSSIKYTRELMGIRAK